jgi:hypothetical protein
MKVENVFEDSISVIDLSSYKIALLRTFSLYFSVNAHKFAEDEEEC